MKPVMLRDEGIEQGGSVQRAAISLAYDGGDPSHLEIAVPALAQRDLKGTFFLPSLAIVQEADRWTAVHHDGHEMASHTLDGFTDDRGNLPNWTLEMVEEDLRMSRRLLIETFPRQTDFAFAYPGDQCGCVSTPYNPAPADYAGIVQTVFPIARAAIEGINRYDSLRVDRLKRIEVSDLNYHDLVRLAESIEGERGWGILVFRGIGSGEFAIDSRDHSMFLDYLLGRSNAIRLETVWRQAVRSSVPAASFPDR